MIQPNISLAVETPQVADPLETAGKALSIRGMQQQQQSGALALQQQQRDLASDEAGRKLFASGNPTDDQIMATYGPVKGAGILKNRQEAHKMGVDIQDTKAKIAEKETDYAGAMGAMIKASGNDPHVAEDAFRHAEQLGYGDLIKTLRGQLQQNPEALGPLADHLISQSPAQQKLINEGKTSEGARQRGQAAENADLREAGLQPDKARKIKAEAGSAESDQAMKQFELDAAKATPEQQAAKVAASIDQTKYPEIYKRTLANVTNGVTHQDKVAALRAGSAEVAEREKETDPAIARARTAQAVATKQALTPLEIGQAVQTEIQKAKLSGDAFGGIIDPVARHAAETQYDKDSRDYLGKVSEARRLKDLISAAQNGNKAAPGVIPIEELRSFVNRVNAQELKQVGAGAGSLIDRINGKIQGLKSGQPIPADILRDTAAIADLSEKAAERGYNFNLQVIRQKGAKVSAIKPEDVFGAGGAGGSTAPKKGDVEKHEGHDYKFDGSQWVLQ